MSRTVPKWYQNWLNNQTWYQERTLKAKQIYYQTVSHEVLNLSNSDYQKLCNQKLIFQKRTLKQQNRSDKHLSQSLAQLSKGTYLVNHQEVPEYTLARGYHAPLALHKVTFDDDKNIRIGKTIKTGNHICTGIKHNDPTCACHFNGMNGIFIKAPSNLSKGGNMIELCPCRASKQRWRGEDYAHHYLMKHGITHIYGYRLHNNHNDLHRRQHLDFLIPKQFVNSKQDIGIEIDGDQHDRPFGINKNLSKSQINLMFEAQQIRDEKKNIYCHEHNINLIRVHEINIRRYGYSPTPAHYAKFIYHALDKKLLPLIHINKQQLINNAHKYHLQPSQDEQGATIFNLNSKQIKLSTNHPITPNELRFNSKITPNLNAMSIKTNHFYGLKQKWHHKFQKKYKFIKQYGNKHDLTSFKSKLDKTYWNIKDEVVCLHNYHVLNHPTSHKAYQKAYHSNINMNSSVRQKAFILFNQNNTKHTLQKIYKSMKKIIPNVNATHNWKQHTQKYTNHVTPIALNINHHKHNLNHKRLHFLNNQIKR